MKRHIISLVLLLAATTAWADEPPLPEYGPPVKLADIANQDVNESSGVAIGRANEGVLWTHNDSGDGPRVFAFDETGADRGTFLLTGAKSKDWEDICSFTLGKTDYLLLADVGDNSRKRLKGCRLYIVKEPRLPKTPDPIPGALEVKLRIKYIYPDGPKNCEGVAVDPTSKTIIIITKEELRPPCNVYALKLPNASPKETVTLEKIGELPIRMVVALDISPDGRRAVVLTYGDAFEFARAKGETWADAFKKKPRELKMPPRRQGEAICYGLDGKTLYLTSENLPAPLLKIPVKAQ